uniref:Uncharacterized protein n=1 Tax=Anguilla anguilla TaxID=7936 RepID=A0A0E9SLX2_ANGAN
MMGSRNPASSHKQ